MGVHVFPILTLPPTFLPIPSHPSGSSQCTSPEHPVSCTKPGLAIYFTHDNTHVSMLFSQIIPPSPSPTESKRRFFTSGGQSIGVSVLESVLLINTQDLFPLGLTGWISLQSKGPSRVFSNTTIQRHQFLYLCLFCCLAYWVIVFIFLNSIYMH